jgi:hypothetical protein
MIEDRSLTYSEKRASQAGEVELEALGTAEREGKSGE